MGFCAGHVALYDSYVLVAHDAPRPSTLHVLSGAGAVMARCWAMVRELFARTARSDEPDTADPPGPVTLPLQVSVPDWFPRAGAAGPLSRPPHHPKKGTVT